MLSSRIMHECIKKLLKLRDEESLESLCKLFTTVGKNLDAETEGSIAKLRNQDNIKRMVSERLFK
jgi:hypothetical protein